MKVIFIDIRVSITVVRYKMEHLGKLKLFEVRLSDVRLARFHLAILGSDGVCLAKLTFIEQSRTKQVDFLQRQTQNRQNWTFQYLRVGQKSWQGVRQGWQGWRWQGSPGLASRWQWESPRAPGQRKPAQLKVVESHPSCFHLFLTPPFGPTILKPDLKRKITQIRFSLQFFKCCYFQLNDSFLTFKYD
jgi:hypothetical protein